MHLRDPKSPRRPTETLPTRGGVAVLILAALLPCPGFAEDWLRWGGPAGDFTVEAGALAETWPADGPRRLWKRPLGEGYSSILFRDGRLFTMVRNGENEITVALDARTGSTLWEHHDAPRLWPDMTEDFGLGPNGTPLIAGDRIIAIGISGRLRGLDLATGKELWKVDLAARFGRRERIEEYGYSGSPLPYGGNVLVLVGGERHAVVAFDPEDGSVAWKSDPGGVSYAPPTIARLAGRDQYVYFSPERVVGLDPSTGKTLWSHPIEFNNGNHLTPAVRCDDHHLWVGSQFDSGGGRLLEIKARGESMHAEQRWFDLKMQTSHWTMIRRGDFIYGSIGGNRVSFLSAFRWKTGEIVWRERGFPKAQALFADGKLLFLDESGQLVLARVSPQGLEVLAKAQVTQDESWTLPTLVGTTLYLRDQEHILALDLAAAASKPL